jgi:hypothetical protein
MRLSDIEYEVLIEKYISMGYTRKMLEKRLQQVDPYISLSMLKLTHSHLHF